MKLLRSCQRLGYVTIGLMLISAVARAGELVDRDFNAQNYAYSDHRNFYVYLPSAYDGQRALPLVMVLHGCHQTRDTVLNEFGWDDVAEQNGFILVAPDISTDDMMRYTHCWGYWESKEIHQGQGEVEDLYRIGLQVEQQWRIDSNRRHIVGLSSGGFMANAAAVAHNEYWASAGVHSGGGYNESAGTYAAACANPRESSGSFRPPAAIAADMRSEMDSDYTIPVMLIHSKNDCAVGYGVEGNAPEWGGLTSNRDAWLAINGGPLYATVDCSRDGIECRHQKFGTAARATLEVVSIVGLIQGTDANKGHYWSGGKADGQWTKTRGPNAAGLFWNFFQRHPRNSCATCPGAPSGLTATHIGQESISLSWNADSAGNPSGYHLYRDGSIVRPDPIPLTSYTDTGLQQARTYTYHVTAVNDAGEESLPSNRLSVKTNGVPSCRSYSATLTEHLSENRAYQKERCVGWWCWFWPWPKVSAFFAKGSDDYLGTDGATQVILYTVDDENYSTVDCSAGG
jgi:poly(hydroxyalkanoate) depolymerase family esterase